MAGPVSYTHLLRTAKWSDGQRVKAGDFVYAWRRLVDPASHSPYANLLSVVSGYQEARAEKDPSLLQVSAPSDSVFEVTLNGNFDWFLREVCTSPATMPLRQDVVQRLKAVSYTHLDVYKRQVVGGGGENSAPPASMEAAPLESEDLET